MTAEIAVFNKEAVALAADSAVTSTIGGGQKIFTSVNKIFSLSEYLPVGMMFYNSAYFMGIPWDTIIKSFRLRIPKEGLRTLEEYSNHFISFFKNNKEFFGPSIQKDFTYGLIFRVFLEIKVEIEGNVQSIITDHGSIDDKEVKNVVSKVIDSNHQKWKNFEADTNAVTSITVEQGNEIAKKYNLLIKKALSDVFQQIPLSTKSKNQLFEIVRNIFVYGTDEETSSGIVIAGFGQKEVFPSVISFVFEGVFNNNLKYHSSEKTKIGTNTDGSIIAFAQREMVSRFMVGVDPLYLEAEQGFMSELPRQFAEAAISGLTKYDESEKNIIKEQLKNSCQKIVDEINKEMHEMRDEQFCNPITDVISLLPKTELGKLAESLVSLTSLKRRFSLETETVAEPIDVALISKGDGFIWIKRKHYFLPELNPGFFARRYKENEK